MASMKRQPFIDVHRGLVVVLMVMHHTIDAWIRSGDRHGQLYRALRTLGGLPAPGFLFLAGLSSALVLARERTREVPASARARQGLRRGMYILGLAFAFRFVSFFAGLNDLAYWPIMFRVDILNCMGVSLALVGVLCALPKSGRTSAFVATLLGLAFLLPAPLVWGRHLTFPTELLGHYVAGTGPLVLFPVFPCLAFAAFGFVAGESLARLLEDDPDAARVRAWARGWGLAGLALWLGAAALDHASIHLFPSYDWWNASPAYMTMRLGIQLLVLWLCAETATRYPAPIHAKDPLQLVGRHSLAIYVIHVELVYGRYTSPLHGLLSLRGAIAAMAGMNVVMYGLAQLVEWRDRRARPRPAPAPAT